MEDSHCVYQAGTWGCDDPTLSYTAIYDGHGGRETVEFLDGALVKNVAAELNCKDDASIHARLERAFLMTDVQSHMAGIKSSGATVAMCLVKKHSNGRITIHSANAGDARAVLSTKPNNEECKHSGNHTSGSHRLTFDHRADDPKELSRVEDSGGFVMRNRVLGVLAVARSLGDHGIMKEFVVGKPYVDSIDFDHGEGEFIILACDGLFDVMDDQEAVDLVRNVKGREGAAQMLCNEAIKRGSTDNVTVIVSWL